MFFGNQNLRQKIKKCNLFYIREAIFQLKKKKKSYKLEVQTTMWPLRPEIIWQLLLKETKENCPSHSNKGQGTRSD